MLPPFFQGDSNPSRPKICLEPKMEPLGLNLFFRGNLHAERGRVQTGRLLFEGKENYKKTETAGLSRGSMLIWG